MSESLRVLPRRPGLRRPAVIAAAAAIASAIAALLVGLLSRGPAQVGRDGNCLWWKVRSVTWRFDDKERVARHIRVGGMPGDPPGWRTRWMGPARVELRGDDGCLYTADLAGIHLPDTNNLFILWIDPAKPALRTSGERRLDPEKVEPDEIRLTIANDVQFIWKRGVDVFSRGN